MSAIFFGILHGWSIASPWSGGAVWWWQLIAMTWLVGKVIRSESPKVAFKTAAWFSLAWFCSSMWWLYISMHHYGSLPVPLAALGVVALSALLGSFYAVGVLGFATLRSENNGGNVGKPLQDALLFAALWLLAELLRGTVMTGLPWSAAGYAHIDGPLASTAPSAGVYGISALAAFIAALFVLTRSCLLKVGIIVLLCVKASLMPSPQAIPGKASQTLPLTGLTVRLLQGNIPQNEKFDAKTGVATALTWYQDQMLAAQKAGVDVVVAPETAIPLLPHQLPAGYWPSIFDAFTKSTTSAALVGIPLGSNEEGYTNSVLGLSSNAAPYRYDKHHLVPFGEFIPPLFRWFTDLMNIPLGDFNRGGLAQPSFVHKGERFAINICYEDLFGEELAQRFTNPTTAPTVFVNISNMGWFGSGMAIDQHLNISRMRAIEFNRPVIRATNTGATAVIDHKGVVTHSLARVTRGALDSRVVGQTEMTTYAKWTSQYGLQPLWVLACSWVIWVFIRKKYMMKS
ncbi:MAG: putative apolipoprotein N-acyltransferase N-acyltransferase, rane protein [Pseudomonadota bacterium]